MESTQRIRQNVPLSLYNHSSLCIPISFSEKIHKNRGPRILYGCAATLSPSLLHSAQDFIHRHIGVFHAHKEDLHQIIIHQLHIVRRQFRHLVFEVEL